MGEKTHRCAVYMFFVEDTKVLLLRRANTGYCDGSYSLVAGHVEPDETVLHAAVREAQEEVGTIISPQESDVFHVMNRSIDRDYVAVCVEITSWEGEIKNMEPEKCDDLQWFDRNNLPENLAPEVKIMFKQWEDGNFYSEQDNIS